MTDIKQHIVDTLAAFARRPLADAAIGLFETLGYRSEKVLDLENTPAAFLAQFDHRDRPLRKDKALFDHWKSVEFLFQLTDDEIRSAGGQDELAFDSSAKVDYREIHSYLILALDLKPGHYTRTGLATITREINRLFDMPTLILFRYDDLLTFSVIDRRLHKRDQARDVLEKITLIKDIRCANPHRAHVEVLYDLALPVLYGRRPFSAFVGLHDAWREVLNIEALNDRFYRRIREWFFLATQHVKFPHGGIDDENIRNRTNLIRLLTRVVFCWFAKEKDLIPEALFKSETADRVLKKFDPASLKDGSYYKAILQNLFFPTLSVPLDQREFRHGIRQRWPNKHYMDHRFYRHEKLFHDAEDFSKLFEQIPFLNGGLFECLDTGTSSEDEIRVDGFSDTVSKQPLVPNALFFGQELDADLSEAYGSHKKAHVKVDGLFHILNAYKFTVAENTPVEQEIALDPELLGRIFEELLAEYSFDTEAAARKATGSFYTPRTVVNYMVDASLTAHLAGKLTGAHPRFSLAEAEQIITKLLEWSETKPDLTEVERQTLADAIYDITVIDPACGSGAFPMGMLQKLVHVLNKLDLGHERWKERILADIPVEVRDENRKMLETGSVDFNWKLGLILHCIYGIDIQPIAVQIAKLRCFIALLVDFEVDRKAGNFGVPPLPNLDFKFVAANSLIRPPGAFQLDGLALEDPFFAAFARATESFFFVRDPTEKQRLRGGIETLIGGKIAESERQVQDKRDQLVKAKAANQKGMDAKDKRGHDTGKQKLATTIVQDERDIEAWKSYRNIFAYRNQPVLFFDTPYFFPEIKAGFDIVIGNPPFVRQEQIKAFKPVLQTQGYECFDGVADLYVYFFERGVQLLRPDGVLCYICSHTYFRAGFGEKLRKYLADRTRIRQVIDFGDADIFTSIAYPSILLTQKVGTTGPSRPQTDERLGEASLPVRALTWTPGPTIEEFPAVFAARSFLIPQKDLKPDGWRIEGGATLRLLDKLRTAGKPLREYVKSRVYRGITTGLNEAFVVDRATRDRLIAEHKSSAEVLKPFLRGRDVKRWRVEFGEQYLIKIESSENKKHPWSGLPDKKAEAVFADHYPTIHAHFKSMRQALIDRYDQGKFLWELRACAYWQEFEQPKIVSTKVSITPTFAFDATGHCLANTAYFFPCVSEGHYLLALLNSSVFFTYAKKIFLEKQNGWYEVQPDGLEAFPIPAASAKDRAELEGLVARVLALVREKSESANIKIPALEQEINARVHRLYGLTPEEIKIVEGANR